MKKMEIYVYVEDNQVSQKHIFKMFDMVSCIDIPLIKFSIDISKQHQHGRKNCFKTIRGINSYVKKYMKETGKIVILELIIRYDQIVERYLNCIEKYYTNLIVCDVPDGKETNLQKLSNKLGKHNVAVICKAKGTSVQNIERQYRIMRQYNVPIYVPDLTYDDKKLESFFMEWVYDSEGCGISLFTDIASMHFLDYAKYDCRHQSCLGKKLVICFDGTISFCNKNIDNSVLANIKDIAELQDIFDNDRFIDLIKSNINWRNNCKKNCKMYTKCLGGCPIELCSNEITCFEQNFMDFYHMAVELFEEIAYVGDYSKINPALKKIILGALVSGKMSNL